MNDTPRKPKQEVSIRQVPGRSSLRAYNVEFYRDGIRQFDAVAKSESFALRMKENWEDGGTQATIAQLIHNS